MNVSTDRVSYGALPLLNTSQHSTPNDHTSLMLVNLRSRMLSGAIHFTGTCIA